MSLASHLTGLEDDAKAGMGDWADASLFWVCIGLAAVFVVLALIPGHRWLKIGVIAWAVLP